MNYHKDLADLAYDISRMFLGFVVVAKILQWAYPDSGAPDIFYWGTVSCLVASMILLLLLVIAARLAQIRFLGGLLAFCLDLLALGNVLLFGRFMLAWEFLYGKVYHEELWHRTIIIDGIEGFIDGWMSLVLAIALLIVVGQVLGNIKRQPKKKET